MQTTLLLVNVQGDEKPFIPAINIQQVAQNLPRQFTNTNGNNWLTN